MRSLLSTGVGVEISNAPGRVACNGLAFLGEAPGHLLAIERGVRSGQLDKLRDSLPGHAVVSDQGAGKAMLEISGS